MLPRGNGFRRLSALSGLVCLAIIPARAAAESPKVEVDCPAMTPEQQASVEARSRAELAMLGVSTGEIGIRCWPPLAVVQYAMSAEPVRSSSRHLVGETDAWIDQILSIVHVLFAPTPESTASVPIPVAQPTASAAEVAPVPIAPQRTATPAQGASQWRPELPKAEPLTSQLSIGGCAEVWAKPLAILPGVCALLGLRSSFSRIALVGGIQWSAARVHDMSIRHWQGGVEWSLGHPLWLAVSGQLSVFQLMPSAGLSPSSSTKYNPSVTLRGGTVLPLGREQLRAGAGVRLQSGYDVHVNGQAVFSVPIVALAMDLAYELSL